LRRNGIFFFLYIKDDRIIDGNHIYKLFDDDDDDDDCSVISVM